MSSYILQKVHEKRKQLSKLEERLFDIHRQVDLLTAELAAYEDVLANSEAEKPAVRTKPEAHKNEKNPQEINYQVGHWPGLMKKYARATRFTIDDVVRDLAAIGQPNKRKSVRAKMAKLVNDGVLERISDGVFRVASEVRGVSGDELRKAGIIPPHARLVGEV